MRRIQSTPALCPSPAALRYLRSTVAAPSPRSVPVNGVPCHRHHFRMTTSGSCITARCHGRPRPRPCFATFAGFSTTANRRTDLPKNPQTHYDFFTETLPDGPPPAGPFDVDLKALRNEFLKLQSHAHPDRHPPDRKAAAEALSARINEAYKTLQSPLLRAQYLLSLKGDDAATDDAAKLGDDSEDQELLMQVMDLREQIEAAENADEIAEIKQENDLRIAESVGAIADAFEQDHVAEAAKEAVRLRYWTNVHDTLEAWEQGKPPPSLQH